MEKTPKSVIALFLMLEVLSSHMFKNIYFPMSLTLAILCAVNRTWNRSMKNERERLSNKCDIAIKKVGELNTFLEEKQTYKNWLRALSLRITKIRELESTAKILGIKTFSLDDGVTKQQGNRVIKQTTALRGSRSLHELQLSTENIPKRITIENQLRKLLTSPVVSEQKDLIQGLKAVLEEEASQGTLPHNYLNMKHPLVEKLAKETKRLEVLEKQFDSHKIYTLQELEAKEKEVQIKLFSYISEQKNIDKKALKKLFESSSSLEYFWSKFNEMLPLLPDTIKNTYEENQTVFKETVETLHEKLTLEKIKSESRIHSSDSQQISNEKIEQYKVSLCKLFDDYHLSNPFGAQLVFNHLAKESNGLKTYFESIQAQFLLSNTLAGILDAPYLYIGIISLVVLSSPLVTSSILLALTLSVISFCIVSVFFRAYEEVESNNACKLQILKVNIAQCDNNWKVAQKNYYKAYERFKINYFKAQNSQIDGTAHAKLFLKETSQAKIIPSLLQAYNESQRAREALNDFINPSYYSAIMHGAKDGLSLFGAIASSFYALNIALMALGSAFSPVVIIGAVAVGITALLVFVSYRLYLTYKTKQELRNRFQIKHAGPDDFYHDKPSLPLGWADINTDGLTKGELYFQELHEIARSVCAGLGGKSHSLMEFLFSHYKDDASDNKTLPIVLIVFTATLSIIYGAVLALRAFSNGYKKYCIKSPVKTETLNDTDIKDIDLPMPKKALGQHQTYNETVSVVSSTGVSTFFTQENDSKEGMTDLINGCTHFNDTFLELIEENSEFPYP